MCIRDSNYTMGILAFIYSTILLMVNLGSIAGTYNNFEILQIEIDANQKACVIDT